MSTGSIPPIERPPAGRSSHRKYLYDLLALNLRTLPFDPIVLDLIIILADRRDGKPLAEKEGPLRIIVPEEKREARWVRQLVSFTIRRRLASGVKRGRRRPASKNRKASRV